MQRKLYQECSVCSPYFKVFLLFLSFIHNFFMGMEALVLEGLPFLSVTHFILSLFVVTFHCNIGSKHKDGPKLVVLQWVIPSLALCTL